MTARALRRHLNQTANDFPDLLAELRRYLSGDPALHVKAFPGTAIDVPLWILGSSTDSAKLAASEGLPYTFASHFAPEDLLDALRIYRERFQPSVVLQKPYVMVALSVLVANSDEEAQMLFSSSILRYLSLTRGKSTKTVPPVKSIEPMHNEAEASILASRFALACVGSQTTVRTKLESIINQTSPDELIIASDCFDQAARLRSYALLASLKTNSPVTI